MSSTRLKPYQKLFLLLAFSAALWLALGNSVRVLVASSQGQSIDITICTSMGMKKISMKVDHGGEAPVMMKHCGNAAFAVLFLPPSHPLQLSFATPGTVASWQFVQVLGIEPQRTWENAPPPLRGPPSTFA
jgi:hypothetical protein